MDAADWPIAIYVDGANLTEMRALVGHPWVKGFTTNPSLMWASKVTNYMQFCRNAVTCAAGKPISLEVLEDHDYAEIMRQAIILSGLGENVWVKVPVMSRFGKKNGDPIKELARRGVKVNITAVLNATLLVDVMPSEGSVIVSIFAGRISDTGMSPVRAAEQIINVVCSKHPTARTLWASVRQIRDVKLASGVCDIITIPVGMLQRLTQLDDISATEATMQVVKQFHHDSAGYTIL